MASENIELSNKGIKFSYRRFLSDSAAGYLVLLMFLVFYHFGANSNFLEPKRALADSEGPFIFLLLLFLATPIGISINAISWFLFEWPQGFLESRYLSSNGPIIRHVRQIHFLERAENEGGTDDPNDKNPLNVNSFFGLKKDSFVATAERFKKFFEIYFSDRATSLEHLVGIRIFLRNVEFLLLILMAYFAISSDIGWLWIAGSIVSIGMLMYIRSVLLFYEHTLVLSEIFVMCCEAGFTEMRRSKGDVEGIMRLAISTKDRWGSNS